MFLELGLPLVCTLLKPDHQDERMNLELHTNRRELVAVRSRANYYWGRSSASRVYELERTRAVSYRVRFVGS
ncbi:hypothetical protein DY000_02034203 [Brassica cretica]|uniref:Uncharacterized protein n=1 Tax=Brassica cretica TaxID=69181 RepID=A0ABQ7DQJ8_BRACR|nr:hypothetical protein DY000_02034203 [Brassica cretica]